MFFMVYNKFYKVLSSQRFCLLSKRGLHSKEGTKNRRDLNDG